MVYNLGQSEKKREERRSDTDTKLSTKCGLVIENNIDIIDYYRTILSESDFTIDIKSNFVDAVQAINNKKYTFIILDGRFPQNEDFGTDNYFMEVIDLINYRMQKTYHRPLIIHISADNNFEEISTALQSGQIDCYIRKPLFDFQNLVSILKGFTSEGVSFGNRDSDMVNNTLEIKDYFTLNSPVENNKLQFTKNNIFDYLKNVKSRIFVSKLVSDYFS